jgi:hypothetical protein
MIDTWEALTEAVAHWEYELLEDLLLWNAWRKGEGTYAKLTAWLVRHAPARLWAHALLKNCCTGYGCSALPNPLAGMTRIGLTTTCGTVRPEWDHHRSVSAAAPPRRVDRRTANDGSLYRYTICRWHRDHAR